MSKTRTIKTLPQLTHALEQGYSDFAILLAGGSLLSRKTITTSPRSPSSLRVYNHIDDTTTPLTRTNIPEAMQKGAFVVLLA